MSNRIITIALTPDVTNPEAIEEIANSFRLNRYVATVTIGEPEREDFLADSDNAFRFRRLMFNVVCALFPSGLESEKDRTFRDAILAAHAIREQK